MIIIWRRGHVSEKAPIACATPVWSPPGPVRSKDRHGRDAETCFRDNLAPSFNCGYSAKTVGAVAFQMETWKHLR